MMIEEGDVFDVLDRARQAGKVRYIGYSSYSGEASQDIIDTGQWDTLQIAYNIFDQRNASTVIPAARAKDMGIIIRSALLKGALTDKAAHLPERLTPLIERIHALDTLLSDTIPTIPQLALRFVLSNPNISAVIVGADKIPYLEEAASVSDGNTLPTDIYDQILTLAIDNPKMINPSTWGIP
jgi:aryl-alcohol dehydrogenase-like predicted oxidoreductase